MGKKITLMVVDTETATLPMCAFLARTPEEKKKLAIAKPLIYDIGWTVTNRKGELLKTRQFLVAETFSVPVIFNTGYYKEKRPIYLKMLENGETTIKPWNDIINIFLSDLEKVDAVGAFNSMFDFKKAIPFTELYIKKLYSLDYDKWEELQYKSCLNILTNEKKEKDPNFDPMTFKFRGKTFKLFDLWGLAVEHLLNSATYKTECLNHNLLTQSGLFFKTSAESTYQYLCNKYDFVESHTALDDAIIETFILHKIAQRHAISQGIKYFPFRDLGETVDFVTRTKIPKMNECQIVFDAISNYIDGKEESPYKTGIVNKLQRLAAYMGMEFCPC